jgi:hypothetical protein
MRLGPLLLMMLLVAMPAAAAPAPAQEPDAAVPREAARSEIERILQADNLDTDQLSPRDVADTIAGIARGRAPEDFWTAYQAHVRAWERFAQVWDRTAAQRGESTFIENEEELLEAEQAIGTTFDEVERIARRYGARLPVPRANVIPTI